MDAKAEKLALFRYGLIAPLIIETLPRGELTRRAQEIAARHYEIPESKRSGVSVDTLLGWALRYHNGGFEALAPKPRQDRGQFRAVTPQLARLIEHLKPASHRHDSIARTGPVFRPGCARHFGVHAVSLPETTRPLGKATARPTSA